MQLNRYIDHTLLASTATEKDILALCAEADAYHFFSVCVHPCYVSTAKRALKSSDVKVCAVVGFPLGANDTQTKIFEAQACLQHGADEIDVVVNLCRVKSDQLDLVAYEINQLANLTKKISTQHILKVIIETCYLTQAQKRQLCLLAIQEGADFVKTSTGFGTAGATLEDIRLIRDLVGEDKGVKASGGIKTRQDAMQMILAGANRIGTSSGVAIMQEEKKDISPSAGRSDTNMPY